MSYRGPVYALTLAACCLFIAPTSQAQSAATTQVSPAKSMDALLTNLESEVVPLAEAMPADKYNFAPSADMFKSSYTPDYKGVRTFAQEVAHITQANYFLFLGAAGQEKPDAALGAKLAAVSKMTTKEELTAALKDSFASAHASVATLTAANAWDHVGKDPDNSRAQRAAYAIAHCRDHYGQLVEYLRMNGIVPPASVGSKPANPSKTN